MTKVTYHLGAPVYDDPWDPVYAVIDDGTIGPASTIQFTVTDPYGSKVVFTGNFTVTGGVVTGGTVTGFTARAGSTATTIGSGYAIPATALVEALKESIEGDNDGPFWDLIRGSPSSRAAPRLAAGSGTPASPSLPAAATA